MRSHSSSLQFFIIVKYITPATFTKTSTPELNDASAFATSAWTSVRTVTSVCLYTVPGSSAHRACRRQCQSRVFRDRGSVETANCKRRAHRQLILPPRSDTKTSTFCVQGPRDRLADSRACPCHHADPAVHPHPFVYVFTEGNSENQGIRLFYHFQIEIVGISEAAFCETKCSEGPEAAVCSKEPDRIGDSQEQCASIGTSQADAYASCLMSALPVPVAAVRLTSRA